VAPFAGNRSATIKIAPGDRGKGKKKDSRARKKKGRGEGEIDFPQPSSESRKPADAESQKGGGEKKTLKRRGREERTPARRCRRLFWRLRCAERQRERKKKEQQRRGKTGKRRKERYVIPASPEITKTAKKKRTETGAGWQKGVKKRGELPVTRSWKHFLASGAKRWGKGGGRGETLYAVFGNRGSEPRESRGGRGKK